MKKSIISKILWPIIYMTLIVGACISTTAIVLRNNYYENVFVDGDSMLPTLKGKVYEEDGADFGVTDNRTITKKKLKRFDIVTTYYPFSTEDYDYATSYKKGESKLKNTAYYKIKRLIALPGETFKIEFNELYVKQDNNWEHIEFTFQRKFEDGEFPNYRDVKETTLKDDEYWVMGDNWTVNGSKDCANQSGDKYNGPIYFENLIGKLIHIDGTCTLVYENGQLKCTNKKFLPKNERKYF